MTVRNLTIAVLVVVIAVYHGTGLHFIYWPDSYGYLSQALSMTGSDAYQRADGRSVGYPAFLALPTQLPATALIVTFLQTALVVTAYVLIYRQFNRAAPALAPGQKALRTTFVVWFPVALALSSSYSALQTFILSMLPEILFAVLVLAAVVAVSRFVHREAVGPDEWWRAAATAAIATAPVLVKPHWLFAAPALVLIVAVKLATGVMPAGKVSPVRRFGLVAAALAVSFAAFFAASWPERHLSATVNAETTLFGPRTLFCNHAHMIADARIRHASFRLHADPAIDTAVSDAISVIRARDDQPWKYLGTNGDLCLTDMGLSTLLNQKFPSIDDQRRFLAGAYLGAFRAAPLRFAAQILRQISLGFEIAFLRFSKHSPFDQEGFERSVAKFKLSPSFLAGTTQNGEVGPLGGKDKLKSSVIGWAVLIVLSVTFIPLDILYVALVALSVAAAPLRWKTWGPERRRTYLAYIGVPLAAIFAHHLLIAVAHTFDIWRYAFGMFFVNLLLIATASLFWLEEYRPNPSRTRAGVPSP